ncbi:MAG: aminotransferase class I/II-fold pyridoxal phosphate-dependent enzyme [Gomphosphaeria aponina SAG 52.96 = DSM 107014]|uniref:Aminotransferase class I/II-fold pyridoxal phosphate-dependent enzyme n=1 Tax=Gomphosphaeria aponina SAG 52.96 = DSM 107014 TaxID=1521640 RepID=A0A941GNP9_9CHRO|nr:aminotransferase class I/II-fold pyridoxal phosphate-dependent enzyme [Gomphosphaeria aponina SAG 52.96 = DSM 107014]
MFSQARTPLLDSLKALSQATDGAFYAPGHKKGQGIYPPLADLLGKSVFLADLPELPELDNLFAPEGVILEAQELAAAAFGAEKTWFLVNGSTCGIIAAILATCGPGEKIILPRNSHQSAYAGLIFSGAVPIFLNPEYNFEFDIPYSITPAAVETALQQHPDSKAVMMIYPTYQGVCGDVKAIAQITHQYQIPLLVDEAHGAHFTFHPALPPSALSAGADLTVQSTHKVLGAMTQASMLHLQGNRIERQKITQALQLLQSTSPSYLLLASLDAARQQMALQGKELLHQTLQLADSAINSISQIPGLSVLLPDLMLLDQTRLTVNVSQWGLSGFAVDEILHTQLGVTAELPMLKTLTFIITFGNNKRDIAKLVSALRSLEGSVGANGEVKITTLMAKPAHLLPHPCMSPREAFLAAKKTLPRENAVGCISGEIVCPYPPGIPVLFPGEIISVEAIDYLQEVLTLGGRITGCQDPTLYTLQVISCKNEEKSFIT